MIMLVLQCKQTWTIRFKIVAGRAGARVPALVKELEIAWINGLLYVSMKLSQGLLGLSYHGLIIRGLHKVAVRDIVGPSRATVGFSRERRTLRSSLHSPVAVQAAGGEGTEVSAT
jgi:hypothetical protein